VLDEARTLRVTFKNGGGFTTSEAENYAYWTERIAQAEDDYDEVLALRMRLARMSAMKSFPSKLHYARVLAEQIGEEKTIIFANTKAQADQLAPHTYYTGNKLSKANLENFSKGAYLRLACVDQLNEGVNIPQLRQGIILHAYASNNRAAQRIGRLLRLNPEECCTAHVLVYTQTIDEEWVDQALTAFDPDKVLYTINLLDVL
jgi:superfamily II DNA or RNA helicase